MHKIADVFSGNVIRRKLEKIIGKYSAIPKHEYLEFHSKYEIVIDQIELFRDIVERNNGHTARNILKDSDNPNSVFYFATTRTHENFKILTKALNRFKRLNSLMECVVYDDNPNVDSNWGCLECGFKSLRDDFKW